MEEHLTQLAPRARVLFHIQALMSLVLFQGPFSVGAAIALGLIAPFSAVAIGLGLWLFFLFLLAVWYPSFVFDRWGYALREDDLLIARGVLVRRVTAIPTNRIQHVDMRQGPLEQWMGLARVQVYTASGMGADGVIPGLWLEDAEDLRDRLVRLEGDSGV